MNRDVKDRPTIARAQDDFAFGNTITKRAEILIGSRVKHARMVKGLTLRQVAEKIGCSPSHISKVENDRLRPSLSMLHSLASALGINVASLFSGDAVTGLYSLVRAGNRPAIRVHASEGTGISEIARLISNTAGALLDAHVHLVEPGAGSGGVIQHPGEELGYILEGELEMTVAGEVFVAHEGDCFYYRACLEHGYRNTSDRIAKVLWVCTPPSKR